MTQGSTLGECLARMGRVLIGRPLHVEKRLADEAVQLVKVLEKASVEIEGNVLRSRFDTIVNEPLPADMVALLNRLGGGVERGVVWPRNRSG